MALGVLELLPSFVVAGKNVSVSRELVPGEEVLSSLVTAVPLEVSGTLLVITVSLKVPVEPEVGFGRMELDDLVVTDDREVPNSLEVAGI